MCLVLLAHAVDPRYPLIVAGNRDEFHRRPTQEAHWWPDWSDVVGGRDLQANGTWLAMHRNGRFATVMNHRDAEAPSGSLSSRGHLVTDFLASDLSASKFIDGIDGDRYGGFNLLVHDGERLAYLSNRGGGSRELAPGIYGVANATLDTVWPKVKRTTGVLEAMLDNENVNPSRLLRLLDDRERASVREVSEDEAPFEVAHALSAPFIVMPDYGTRCSTVLLRDAEGRVQISEKRFDADGNSTGQSDFAFEIGAAG